uniref:Uncharacterized protein n=1 Tax=Arundo donax TaxID=35708 RepID=A0A0A8ZXT4_ARUDO
MRTRLLIHWSDVEVLVVWIFRVTNLRLKLLLVSPRSARFGDILVRVIFIYCILQILHKISLWC